VLAQNPDGVFLSNGPGRSGGDRGLCRADDPGILDTDIAGLRHLPRPPDAGAGAGGKTVKMNHGHHGANHPVKDLETGKVEITSMNHGFTVDSQTLPEGVIETHVSLFDGSNCGIRMKDRPVFSVQYHPEASPGTAGQLLPVRTLRRAIRDRARRRRRLNVSRRDAPSIRAVPLTGD
jgi:carbamoyl-phosphate synthase small subunit